MDTTSTSERLTVLRILLTSTAKMVVPYGRNPVALKLT